MGNKPLLFLAAVVSMTLLAAYSWEKASHHTPGGEYAAPRSAHSEAGKQARGNENTEYDQNIFQIRTLNLPPETEADDFLYFSGEYIFMQRENRAVAFSLTQNREVDRIPLKKGDWIIPTPSESKNVVEDIMLGKKNRREPLGAPSLKAFIFKKSPTPYTKYQVLDHPRNRVLVTIRSDPELNSVDHEIRTVGFLNLKAPLIPIFMNAKALLFHDQTHFYVIENPVKEKDSRLKFYKINDILYQPQLLISLKALNGTIRIVFFNVQEKTIRIFEISRADFISTRKISFQFTEMPLAIEYIDENSMIIYFTYGYINLKRDNTFIQNYYGFNHKNLFIRSILIDCGANRRILVDRNNRLYLLLL